MNHESAHASPSAAAGGERRLPRRAAILRFLFRYRKSGVFNGLSLEPAMLEEDTIEEGSPEKFADDLEKVCVATVESGKMTKDLALLIGPDQNWLTTEGFFEAIVENLDKKMGS